MKICQIITTLELGGAETLLANFCNILVEDNEITVIYLKGEPKIQSFFDSRIRVIHVPLGFKCSSQIRSLFEEWQPDIVHTHLGHADLIGLWAARGLGIKMFCTMHNIFFKWDWRDNAIFFLYKLYFSTIARNCQVVCISDVVKNHVVNNLGVKQSNSHLLYNGIPELGLHTSKENAREELLIGSGKFVVLFVGRLEKQKAVHVLINAIPELVRSIPELLVEIVGVGSLQTQLEQQVVHLGLQKYVVFKGNTLHPQIYFAAADIFVLPSIFEGLGIVILEAFRASLPVIASNIEGPGEIIENGKNGFLFQSGDSKGLSEKIVKLYSSKALRIELGTEARKRFEGNFSIDKYAASLQKMYSSHI